MTANKKGNKTTQKQTRRRAHGSAWHWQQTDAWYFTPPGTKRREALLDSSGQRIKGKSNKQAAELALARLKAKSDWKRKDLLRFLGRLIARSIRLGSQPGKELCSVDDQV